MKYSFLSILLIMFASCTDNSVKDSAIDAIEKIHEVKNRPEIKEIDFDSIRKELQNLPNFLPSDSLWKK
ncbi:MAG: hypothetical protein COA33_010785 [Fluviicola sp.]|nr:hypothetical protein [Fluviicola sp.]